MKVVPANHGESCPAPHRPSKPTRLLKCSTSAPGIKPEAREIFNDSGRRSRARGAAEPWSTSAKPSPLVVAALAMTTATYGSTTAPTIRIGHSQWIPASDAMIAPTKQSVRIAIENR